MGASAQPEIDPGQLARIQANVAKMRSMGAPDEDVVAYLQHEDSQTGSMTPAQIPTDVNIHNLLRSAAQGASLGFAGKFGMVDTDKAKAFQHAHPVYDFLAKAGGGIVAPAAAALMAPEAAAGLGVGGLMALGAGQGAIESANASDGGLKDRAASAAEGAGLGALTTGATVGAGKLVNEGVGLLARKLAPDWSAKRALGGAARGLLDDPAAVQSRMNDVNALAPGGSTPATAAIAPETGKPRLLSVVRTVGASPEAARAAEAATVAQRDALTQGMRAIGDKMNALNTDVPITPELRATLNQAKHVLGASRVDVPPPDVPDVNPLGIEKSTPFQLDPEQHTISTSELRTTLSDLRVKMRALEQQGIDANGVTKHAVRQAHDALKGIVYDQVPGYQPLDAQYGTLADETRALDQVSPAIENSRQNHAGHSVAGTAPGSLGASLPSGAHGAGLLLEKLFANKEAGADATARYVLSPSEHDAVQNLLNLAPKKTAARTRGLLHAALTTSALPGAMRGLLSPAP
jgi:hypothetical protein